MNNIQLSDMSHTRFSTHNNVMALNMDIYYSDHFVLVDAYSQIHCSLLENFILHTGWYFKYASWVLLLVFMSP